MTSSPRWLSRYQQGQREQVWQESRQLGGAAREPEAAHAAQLVCDEMGRRARQNIEATVDRLPSDGDRFHADIAEVVHTHLNEKATMLVVEWWTPAHGLRRTERE